MWAELLRPQRENRGFLGRLRSDVRANTLVMMAIALIPITGLAGSAIDTARLYFVKVRLQQACDAGALAGRKFMVGTDFNANAQTQSRTFFANNFKTGMFGSGDPTFTPTQTADSQVHGEASVVVPMTLTKIMGAGDATLNVSCEAKLEIPNLDVMFVLDTTGSMNAPASASDTQTKIAALRESVTNFYNAVEDSKQTGTQVRYGFVPYSTSVNVGLLLKPDWIADKWKYQSRVDDGDEDYEKTTTSNTTTDYSAWRAVSGDTTTTKYQTADETCITPPNTYKATDVLTTVKTEQKPDGTWTYKLRQRTETGSKYSVSRSGGFCNFTQVTYNNLKTERDEVTHPGPGTTTTSGTYQWWMYRQVEYDVTPFKKGNSSVSGASNVKYPIANGHGDTKVSWTAANACIEERKTVVATDYSSIPSGAYDMDIDMVPNPSDPDTQWGPELPQLVYARNGINNYTTGNVRSTSNFTNMNQVNYYTCPSAARKLGAITSSQLQSYLNGLKVDGKTYHDIGFVWGARLISPTGLFASENATAPNGSDISRHIIFMTDGDTETDINQYDAYGLSGIDRRRTSAAATPTNADQDKIVSDRTLALCKAARAKNITVWVIAFGTDLTDMLRGCATPGRAYQANNADELNTTFSNIASQIAKLRVSK